MGLKLKLLSYSSLLTLFLSGCGDGDEEVIDEAQGNTYVRASAPENADASADQQEIVVERRASYANTDTDE